MKASYYNHILNFKRPSGTSRGVLSNKETWLIKLKADGKIGFGECNMFKGLSVDDVSGYEEKLKWTCENIYLGLDTLLLELQAFPSIQFGLETAFRSLENETPFIIFPSKFTKNEDSIAINGLIWMGSPEFMKRQIKEKIGLGFSCIKLKIGAIDFETEYSLLKSIRNEYSSKDIELRVDANGAFSPQFALDKLKRLSELDLHSIEQPIKQKQVHEMARLCENSPLPIALDEELIGIYSVEEKHKLLQTIRPQFIILKPALIGGFKGGNEWISAANKKDTGWWITSALESNIGLNAIAQWTYTLDNLIPQGLGTGGLFTNNFDSPLTVKNGTLQLDKSKNWNLTL